MKKCSVCGKEITEGYVWDGTDCFCSEECLDSVFETPGTAAILIEEGDRVEWEQFAETNHYMESAKGISDLSILADHANRCGNITEEHHKELKKKIRDAQLDNLFKAMEEFNK